MKIGILGGSFNPAHLGHMKLSLSAIELLDLDSVWWLITKQNPLKSKEEYLPYDLRIKKAALIANGTKIKLICTEEETNSTYAIDNLRHIKKKNIHDNFIYLMGADSFISLDKWKDYENIFEEVPIAVFNRLGFENHIIDSYIGKKYEKYRLNYNSRGLLYKKNPCWIFIKDFKENISSTELRLEK
ncbi:MAG: nicotinate-nucleotide adenylyltransferase [Candidatus Pelagibacterales bacterium]|jgi:nicotinate-nucleotide adenylyltransferase|tara:strand:- start:2378 stop:2935 length:558 start_codon:yes stop_codon:yes gene_type:complete